MTFIMPALIPELEVADLDRSLAVYLDVLGFRFTRAGRRSGSSI